jgi:hypothetical protein
MLEGLLMGGNKEMGSTVGKFGRRQSSDLKGMK